MTRAHAAHNLSAPTNFMVFRIAWRVMVARFDLTLLGAAALLLCGGTDESGQDRPFRAVM
jgi:hypothetical protein